MKKLIAPLLSVVSIALLCILSSHWAANATEPEYGRGWTPVYLTFPDPEVLYVECIQTNDPDDYCKPTPSMPISQ